MSIFLEFLVSVIVDSKWKKKIPKESYFQKKKNFKGYKMNFQKGEKNCKVNFKFKLQVYQAQWKQDNLC